MAIDFAAHSSHSNVDLDDLLPSLINEHLELYDNLIQFLLLLASATIQDGSFAQNVDVNLYDLISQVEHLETAMDCPSMQASPKREARKELLNTLMRKLVGRMNIRTDQDFQNIVKTHTQ